MASSKVWRMAAQRKPRLRALERPGDDGGSGFCGIGGWDMISIAMPPSDLPVGTAPPGRADAAAGLRVGLDLVHVARIAESIARFGARFTERVFTAEEIAYCEASEADRDRRFAARFAAKEATWKALGLDDKGHAWRSIEVVHDASQRPSIVLHEPLRLRADEAGADTLSLSLTHEADYAAAVVIANCSPRGLATPPQR